MSDQPVFSIVWRQMLESKSLRELDQHAQQIGRIVNMAHQYELSALYKSMKENLKRSKS